MTPSMLQLRPWRPVSLNEYTNPEATPHLPDAINADPERALILDYRPEPLDQALLYLNLKAYKRDADVFHPLTAPPDRGPAPPGYDRLLRITGANYRAVFDDGRGIDVGDLLPDVPERPFMVPGLNLVLTLRDHTWTDKTLTIPAAMTLVRNTTNTTDPDHCRPLLSETVPCPSYNHLRSFYWHAFFRFDEGFDAETKDTQEDRFGRSMLGWLHHHFPTLHDDDDAFRDALTSEITDSLTWLAHPPARLDTTLSRHSTLISIDHP